MPGLGLIPGDCRLSIVCIYITFPLSPPLLHKLHSQEQGKLTSGLGGRLGSSFGGLPYLSQ